MSRKPGGRPINGVLLLDKSAGMSSNGAVQRAKRLYQASKVGHTGSLDPIATGLLPLCFGEATKFSGFLLDTDKRYRVRVRLGVTTTTADIEGEAVQRRPVPEFSEAAVEAVLQRFRGDITQIPPMHSALKHQGRRLYELARKGVEVERPPRPVCIHALQLLSLEGDLLNLEVHCSKGTYIRSLVEDIGEALAYGGHVEQLRRTAVGELSIEQAVDLEALAALSDEARLAKLLPMDRLAVDLPALTVGDNLAFYLRRGQPVRAPNAPQPGWVRIYNEELFLGLGELTLDGMLAPRRMVRTDSAGQEALASAESASPSNAVLVSRGAEPVE